MRFKESDINTFYEIYFLFKFSPIHPNTSKDWKLTLNS